MYNPNVPSSNMGIAPVSSAPSQPLGPTPMMGMAPMGPPPPMMGGMPPPPMGAPMGPPPIAPITEGLGGFGGSRAGRAGFSERMQRMTAPPKPKPMQPPQQMQQPVQGMQYGGMVGPSGIPYNHNDMNGGMSSSMMPYMQSPYQNFGMPQRGSGPSNSYALDQYGDYLDNQYGDPQFDQKRAKFLMDVSRQEQQTFGGMGGFNTPQPAINDGRYEITERPGPQRNLGDSEYLSGIFGSQAGDYQDLANYQVPQPMADGGAVSTEPLKMALGGFIGNSSTRDYGGDRYTDPYEELDDLYEDVGGYDPTDPYGDNSTAGDDSGGESDYGYLDDDYVYVPPAVPDAIGPPVVVPEESGSDSEQRMIQDLIYGSADPTIGPNNSEEAIQQAVADNKLGNIDLADSSLAQLAGRISRGSDVTPARLSDIAAISQDFAVPEAADTTFSDPDEIFNLSNPISLEAAQVVGPNSRTDASGNLVPGRADTAADIEAGTLSSRNFGPEVMSSDPTIGSSGVPLSQLPTSIGGMSDSLLAGTAFSPLRSSGVSSYGDPIVSNTTPLAPKMALPGGSARTTIEDVGLANAMAAAQAGSNEINALGSDAYTGTVEPAGNINRYIEDNFTTDESRDLAPSLYPNELKLFETPKAAPAVDRPSDIQLELAQPTGGGYQPNLRRGPFGPIGPESSFPGLGKVNSLALPADAVFPQASAEQIGGGITGASTMPGMGSDDPIVYNDTPRPQNTKYLSPFDISELENLEEEYYRTGAGSSDYDPMAAQATAEALKRAEGDVSALDRIAEARMPTDDMQIVDDMRSFPRSSPEFAAPVGDLAQFEPQAKAAPAQTATVSDPDGGDTEVDDVDIFGGNFNRNQFTDRESYKNREDLYSLFGPSKGAEIFNSAVKSLSMGLIDLDKLSAKQREKALNAYNETGKLAYNKNGKLIGVEDPDGRAILLGPQPPKDEDNIGGDDDGCPPGFRKINGVCMPIRRVAQNPATAISDSIEKSTLPSTLRPIVRDVVDDDDDDEEDETSDVGGLTIRRPSYFAGGGAVSDGMGSAIDNFLSSMGGNVKKKSDVAPVGMANGGYVDMQTGRGGSVVDGFGNPVRTRVTTSSMSESDKDERNFSYDPFPDDVYGRGGRGVGNDPVAPDNTDYSSFTLSGSGSYFEPEPEPDNIVQRSLRPQLRPASFDPEPVEPEKDLRSYYTDEFSPMLPTIDMTTGKEVAQQVTQPLTQPQGVQAITSTSVIDDLEVEDVGDDILGGNLQAELGMMLGSQLITGPYNRFGNAFYNPSLPQAVKHQGFENLTPQEQKAGIAESAVNEAGVDPSQYDSIVQSIDTRRPQIVASRNFATPEILGHEVGHGSFEEVVSLLRNQRKPYSMPMNNLGGILAMEEGDPRPRRLSGSDDKNALGTFQYEYGYPLGGKISEELFNQSGFSLGKDHNEGLVQYFDETMGDDPSNPGVGQPVTQGGSTYYDGGGFTGLQRGTATDPYLQKQFETYRKGLPVPSTYVDSTGKTVSFDKRLAEEGLDGYEMALSDLIAKRKGLDPYAERQRRRLPIKPLGYLPGQQVNDKFGSVGVARSFRPQLRPSAPLTSLRPRLRPQGLGSLP